MTETLTPPTARGVPANVPAVPDHARAVAERWCEANRGRIVACYLTPRRDRLLVAVIGLEVLYDDRLGDSIAGLEGELLDAGFRAESTLLPNVSLAELTHFIPPSAAVRVDAH